MQKTSAGIKPQRLEITRGAAGSFRQIIYTLLLLRHHQRTVAHFASASRAGMASVDLDYQDMCYLRETRVGHRSLGTNQHLRFQQDDAVGP